MAKRWYEFWKSAGPRTIDDAIRDAGLDPFDLIYAGSGAISRDRAATMTAVNRSVTLIAGACASSIIDSLRAVDFETKKVIKGSKAVDRVIRTIIDSPDGVTPAHTWIEDAMSDLLISGSAVMVTDAIGANRRLTLCNPLSAYANLYDQHRVSFTLQRDDARSGETAIYPESRVIIARWPRLSGRSGGLQARSRWFGTPPISNLRNALALAMGAEHWAAQIFDRKSGSLGSDYAIAFPNSLSQDAQENLHRMLQAFAGGRSPLVLDGDAKVTKMGVTAADSQLQALRKYQIEEVARVYGVPSVLLNLSDGQTWGSSIEATMRGFFKICVRHHLNRLLEALSYRLLPTGARLVVDESRAYRGDAAALTSIIGAGRPDGAKPGVIGRGELRSLFGLEDEYPDDWGMETK